MTVVTTLITPRWTVHVTDSLITVLQPDGRREPLEWERPKIVPVRKFHGAIAYWGLAEIAGRWSTLEWLRIHARDAESFDLPQDFAQHLAAQLERELTPLAVRASTDKGIGLHFTAYEDVENRWVPELFLISNWQDTSYAAVRDTGVGYSRETVKTLHGRPFWHPADAWPELRLFVVEYLSQGGWFRFNNGDPALYNIAADAILGMLTVMAQRRMLERADDVRTIISLARRPVETVSWIQRDFCGDRRAVGGKIHDLAISPAGEYRSTSGDEP